jgi:hypothetical protein
MSSAPRVALAERSELSEVDALLAAELRKVTRDPRLPFGQRGFEQRRREEDPRAVLDRLELPLRGIVEAFEPALRRSECLAELCEDRRQRGEIEREARTVPRRVECTLGADGQGLASELLLHAQRERGGLRLSARVGDLAQVVDDRRRRAPGAA